MLSVLCAFCRSMYAAVQDCQGEWLCHNCFADLGWDCELCVDLERSRNE